MRRPLGLTAEPLKGRIERPVTKKIAITTDFEGGKIEVLDLARGRAQLSVPADNAAPKFRQWFAFDVESAPEQEVAVEIRNAGECTWARSFGQYQAYVTEDGRVHRAPTSYQDGRLSIRVKSAKGRARVSYYPSYSTARLNQLAERVRSFGARTTSFASSEGGLDIPLFEFERRGGSSITEPTVRNIWVIAQQHPGEAMAGWFVEGLCYALTSRWRAAVNLRKKARVFVVPRMNPDGVALGNHRTDGQGIDMNRTWDAETAPPAVEAVRACSLATGADIFVDVHGDESLPWVFVQSADTYKDRPSRIESGIATFQGQMKTAASDFQTEHSYPYDSSGKPNLAFAANWAQAALGAVALTIEMPFLDHQSKPDPRGFFPDRARRLGFQSVMGLSAALDAMR